MPSQPELLHSPEHLGHLDHQHSAIRSALENVAAIGAELRIGWPLKPGTEHHRMLRTVPSPYPDTNNGIAVPQSIRQPRPSRADRTYSAIKVTGGPARSGFRRSPSLCSLRCYRRAAARWHPGKRRCNRPCSEPAAATFSVRRRFARRGASWAPVVAHDRHHVVKSDGRVRGDQGQAVRFGGRGD
jgi:hypothetical protein